jgi:tRNA(Ile)-lysidine synthase
VLLDRVGLTAFKDCGLKKKQLVLAGVSGGADSLCLLDLLHHLGYPLVVAHFNHQLRPEAADDALQVEAAARERGAAFVMGSADVAGYAARHSLPVEEAARLLRYSFLFEQARCYLAQAVAVGHTADDQVETVLMHLLRGSGLGGLKGMSFSTFLPAWDTALPLVRPLLAVWRDETQAYCAQHGLHPVVDATNADQAYLRNRIRLNLIPMLETYNPQIRRVLYHTASILAGDDAALNQVIDGLWPGCLAGLGPGYAALDRSEVLRLSPGLQRGILRRALAQLRPILRDIDLEVVERALKFFIQTTRTGQMNLVGGLRMVHESDRIYLVEGNASLPAGDWPQIEGPLPLILDAPGEIDLSAGWKLAARLLPVESQAALIDASPVNQDPFQAWLDGDLATFPLVVRPRKRGDRWQPLGLESGSQKVSDFFVNEKCPSRARSGWPLVCSGNQIMWIPGYRPSQACCLSASTRNVLYLRLWQVKTSQTPPAVST